MPILRTTLGAARWAVVLASVGMIASYAAASASPAPRIPPAKPARTTLGPGTSSDRIAVKFAEGSRVRLERDGFAAPHVDVGPLRRTLSSAGVAPGAVRKLFDRPADALDAERARAERSGERALADLNLYYAITVPRGRDAARLCDALNALPTVELAVPFPAPAPPPVDLAPPTPDLTAEQGYRAPAPNGVGAAAIAGVPGADGTGTRIVDIEFSWQLGHEDLELPATANIDTATAIDPFPDDGDHGSAVLGVLGARSNGYGVTGIATGATHLVAPAFTEEYGYDLGRAVSNATALLRPGDVILIEQQTGVCGSFCDPFGATGCGPMEYFPPWYDAIAIATSLGIIVVEAAGNGNVDLDAPACGDAFDRRVRDSGAIVVGAGSAFDRGRLFFSSYGSRVDVQGWGEAVTTAGYGFRFDPGDPRQRYTSWFSGTSSASAIVAGVAAAVQGARLAAGAPPIRPGVLRTLLRATGTPQAIEGFSLPGQIGPLPDLERAIACGNGALDAGETCDDGNLRDRDGCSATCRIETCASCGGEPSSCTPPAKACLKCMRIVGAASLKLQIAHAAARTGCETAKVAGKLPSGTVCANEPKAAAKIAKASAQMTRKIAAACGGADKRCGTGDRDEVAPSVLAWPDRCPDLRDAGCTMTVDDCAGVSRCLDCMHGTAVDAIATQVFAELRPSTARADKRLNKCQQAIGKAVATAARAHATALQRCWGQRTRHRHAETCGDEHGISGAVRAAVESLARTEERLRQRICRACGGADGTCDGIDDLDPTAIGFTPFCGVLETATGRGCWRHVLALNDVVECVSCTAEFHVGCADAAGVPGFRAYPDTCMPPAASCCEPHEGIACADDVCTACVCGEDSFCCRVEWDPLCTAATTSRCAAECSCLE